MLTDDGRNCTDDFMDAGQDELFDVVDDRDQVIGQATRREVHARGLKHRAVHIWLVNPRGELFVQKRAGSKDAHPHKFDSSASGHLAAGEDYDVAARRELHEELGLAVPPARLQRLVKIPACPETDGEFTVVFSLRGDDRPVPNPAEIESGDFVALDRLRADLARHPERYAPSFIKVFDAVERFV